MSLQPDSQEPALDPGYLAYELINGFRLTQMVRSVCELRIPDLVSQGPMSAADLAVETGVLEKPLRRLLRALVSYGVFAETEDDRFRSTPISEMFTSRPGTLRGFAIMLSDKDYQAFGSIMHTLRTDEPAYEKVFGEGKFETLTRDPVASATFNAAMESWTETVAGDVADRYDFSPFRSLIDVGGGTGALAAGILAAHPDLHGAVFDLPAGLESTDDYLTRKGVRDRCEMIPGDFFIEVPGGYDLYFLKSIIHDWSDHDAVRILESCRRAMTGEARLVLVERILPARAAHHPGQHQVFMTDIQMMVVLGGQERTADEFRDLLASSGFDPTGSPRPASQGMHLIEGRVK